MMGWQTDKRHSTASPTTGDSKEQRDRVQETTEDARGSIVGTRDYNSPNRSTVRTHPQILFIATPTEIKLFG